MPCVPPFFHKNRFFTNFKENAKFFNSFLLSNVQLIADNSSKILSALRPKTCKSLLNVSFTEKGTEKNIQNLDSNEAHRHNMISIHMLKISGKTIINYFRVIYMLEI